MEGHGIDSEDKILDHFAKAYNIRTFDDLATSALKGSKRNSPGSGWFYDPLTYRGVDLVTHMKRFGYDYSSGPGPVTGGNVL